MRRCVRLLVLAVLGLLATAAFAVGPKDVPEPSPDKTLITDGSMVHDVGDLWLNITNFNLIGSWPSTTAPWSEAPSALWPAPDGPEHLFGASLWVGGVVLGEPLVSEDSELRATSDPRDVIYETARGAVGGSRYPYPDPDDDHDGLEDEDPLNGLDDDGDGLIDEDFAAVSDQDFRLHMVDNTPEAQAAYPDHEPLNVEAVQQSFQWSEDGFGDFVGFDFAIRNVGVATIQNVYLGFFADFDIPARDAPGGAENDLAGTWEGMVMSPGGELPVRLAYMHDGGAIPVEGWIGLVLLDATTDPGGAAAPAAVGVRAYRIFSGMLPFADGGDPTNDMERYALLSQPQRDPNTVLPADYRVLFSVGPFASLAPDQTVRLQAAMVAGSGLGDLLANAATAGWIYEGVRYDRDHDPATGPGGKEYQVHWLPPTEAPVAAASGRLAATVVAGGSATDAGAVSLRLEARHVAAADLALERTGPALADRRLWTAANLLGGGAGGGGAGGAAVDEDGDVQVELTDADPAGWPRTYRLLLNAADGGTLELDRVELSAPPEILGTALAAHPNPFNPQVLVSYRLGRAGPARLTVHDLRGRLVATLLDGVLPAGPGSLRWDGRDARGRALPGGIYHLRLEAAGGGAVTERVTLLR